MNGAIEREGREQMRHRTDRSAALALIFLVVASFLGGSTPADAQLIDRQGTLAISPDGRRLYKTGFYNPSIDVIDTATHQFLATLPLPVGNNPVLGQPAVSPDGRVLYIPADQEPPIGGSLQVMNLATGSVVATIPT